jgi:hypothetical protein
MTTKEIELIVRYVMQETWNNQLLIGLIIAIVAFIGSYLGSYLKKKGENFATKEDFNEILNQLKTQVTATEQIKSKISHINWANQEWKTLRKVKLEELLSTVYESHEWISKETSYRVFNGPNESITNPFMKLRTIALLYFPKELGKEIDAYDEICCEYKVLLQNIHKEIIEAHDNHAQQLAVREESTPKIMACEEKLIHVRNAIDLKASALMRIIAGI